VKPKKVSLRALTVMACLMTMEIILTRFFSIHTPYVRIGFGFLPISLIGIMFGPFWAGLNYAAGDILGMMIFPSGPYFPGFTLSAFLTGIIFGFVLHKKQITYKRTFLAAITVCGLVNLCLDTYWLTILMGQGVIALLPLRLLRFAIMMPLQGFLIHFVWHRCSSVFGRISL